MLVCLQCSDWLSRTQYDRLILIQDNDHDIPQHTTSVSCVEILMRRKMGDKQKRNSSRSKKRKCYKPKSPKQPAENVTDSMSGQAPSTSKSSSAKKLKLSASATQIHIDYDTNTSESDLGNGLVNLNLLLSLLQRFPCTECGGDTTTEICNLYGMAHRVKITCNACSSQISHNLSNSLPGQGRSFLMTLFYVR